MGDDLKAFEDAFFANRNVQDMRVRYANDA